MSTNPKWNDCVVISSWCPTKRAASGTNRCRSKAHDAQHRDIRGRNEVQIHREVRTHRLVVLAFKSREVFSTMQSKLKVQEHPVAIGTCTLDFYAPEPTSVTEIEAVIGATPMICTLFRCGKMSTMQWYHSFFNLRYIVMMMIIRSSATDTLFCMRWVLIKVISTHSMRSVESR